MTTRSPVTARPMCAPTVATPGRPLTIRLSWVVCSVMNWLEVPGGPSSRISTFGSWNLGIRDVVRKGIVATTIRTQAPATSSAGANLRRNR